MESFSCTSNAYSSGKIIIIILVWSTVALFPCGGQVTFLPIPEPRNHTDIQVAYSTELSSSGEESLDGYISREDFEWISDQSHRDDLKRTVDRVPSIRPAVIPKCTYNTYAYDPVADVCGEVCTRAHCGENMLLNGSEDYKYVGCECRTYCTTACWEKPFYLAGDRCYRLDERGPCPVGQVLVPKDRYTLECGRDACLRSGPTNAVNFSKWALNGGDGGNAKPFLFTYKNECYMTETEAFCKPGKVARFLAPYKSPSCVPRNYDSCPLVAPAMTTVKIPCEPGFVEDAARNLCVPQVEFE